MKPLDGIRVLDLSRLVPGPMCSLVLVDLGASVDKVEEPGMGDVLRHLPPQRDGSSAAFHLLNRGKRSLVLDLKHARGPEVLLRLAAHYDVLLEQFRPGVLERLGIGHARLRALHPRLIVCALTGYGQSGPTAHRAGHDIGYLARAGVLGWQGPEAAAPPPLALQAADVGGALWCAIAILAALRTRDQTGQGSVIDVAMTEAVLAFAPLSLAAALNGAPGARGQEMLTGALATYGCYLTSDGWPVAVGILEPKFWLAFATAVGIEADPSALLPGEHQPALRQQLEGLFSSRTRREWEQFAAEHDCCVEVVCDGAQLPTDPQLAARGVFATVTTSEGPVWTLRTPVAAAPIGEAPAPAAGAHGRAVLADAGFTAAEIDELCAARVVRTADERGRPAAD